jgi:hypothetical protein
MQEACQIGHIEIKELFQIGLPSSQIELPSCLKLALRGPEEVQREETG